MLCSKYVSIGNIVDLMTVIFTVERKVSHFPTLDKFFDIVYFCPPKVMATCILL